ncbi:MAG: hypothetical protein R6V56_06920 [Lentisphaeria bacterium]
MYKHSLWPGWVPESPSYGRGIFQLKVRRLQILLLNIVSCIFLSVPASAFDFAPLLAVKDTEGQRTEWLALGPVLEKSIFEINGKENTLLAAPRPFYSRFTADDGKYRGWDFLWPLSFGRAGKTGEYQFFFPFVHTESTTAEQPNDKSERWWLFPVFFTGQTPGSTDSYIGIFPLYGEVYDIAGYDHINWILFPVYAHNRRMEIESTSILWPIVSYGQGPKLNKWRIFPFYGSRITADKTRRFILWPIIHTASDYGPDHKLKGSGFFVFPLVGFYGGRPRQTGPEYRMWTFLWPFFSGKRYGDDYRLHLPWPFYQRQEGDTGAGRMSKRYFWPLFGSYRSPNKHYWFSLWPIIQNWDMQSGDYHIQRSWLLPYWSSKTSEEEKIVGRSRHLWPLAGYVRRKDQARFWAPALWSKARGGPICRNYAPLWRLYTYARNGETRKHQLLWGLWQHQSSPDTRATSLFPLFDYERTAEQRKWSVLKGLFGYSTDKQTGDSSFRVLWLIKL